jgi:GNAT superfamily N-acetyltransferase
VWASPPGWCGEGGVPRRRTDTNANARVRPLTDTSHEGLERAIEADSIATRVLGGELPLEPHLDADAAWATSPFADPFRNVVVSARFDEASADRRIAEITAAFDGRATPFLWWRAPFHTPADLGSRLDRAGVAQVASGPGMALDLRDLSNEPAGPPELEIRRVTDVAGLRTYLEVLQADEGPPGAPPLFPTALVEAIVAHTGPRLVDEPTPLRYVGWLDGRPVATSRLSLGGGAAGIYSVSTLQAFRGRGIGRALTLAPLRAARDLGYRIATLQSTDQGLPVYRRIGFVEVFQYAIHLHWPPGSQT